MRYASYLNAAGTPTWGAEESGRLHDLGPSGLGVAATLQDAIVGGLLNPAPSIAGAPQQEVDGTTFLPVISAPGKIFCIGVNYHAHREESGRSTIGFPTVFTRFADTLAPHGVDLRIPPETTQYDFEGELALVIGTPGRHVTREEAYGVVAGYAVFNDLSARDWQQHTGQWVPGKNFPLSGPFGPYFVPAEEVGDVTELVLETRVNGEVRQHASVADLIFDVPAIIEYVSGFTPLSPGDVIVTGTPGGVGLFANPQVFLEPGDVVEIEITKLGTLRNVLV